MPLKTAAILREELEPYFHVTPLSGQDLRAIPRSERWNRLESGNAQVAFLLEFVTTDCASNFRAQPSQKCLASRRLVSAQSAQKPKEQKPSYHPRIVSPHQEEAMRSMIRNGARTGNYVTQREVLIFVETEFPKRVASGWLDSFLPGYIDEIRRAVVPPHELSKWQIMRSYLDRYSTLIKSWVPLVSVELFSDLLETGMSDWEERKPKLVLIPTTVENADLQYPVDRGIRHQMLLCFVSVS
jgi:hypothetical protein